MVLFYDLSLLCYILAIRLAALWGNEKARLWVAGRRNWKQRYPELCRSDRPAIWVHCSSLGEFEQGRPLMEDIRARFPQYRIVLTFFSPSGYEIRKNYQGADLVCYLPADTSANARFFLDLIRPEKAFFIKYEFWWHYLAEMKKRGIPVYLVSANFRDEQAFFRPYAGWYRKFLECFAHIFVQNERSQVLLSEAGIHNVTITGDTRFDRVCRVSDAAMELPLVAAFRGDSLCLVAGSTWPADEDLLIRFMKEQPLPVKWIIAPHEIYEHNIQRLMEAIPLPVVRYTRLSREEGAHLGDASSGVLIVDNMGMLSSVYRYGDVAFIGGGFGKGIHNTLEAAAFSIPVLFGPRYHKFQEAVGLIASRGGFSVEGYAGLKEHLSRLLLDSEARREAGNIAGAYVASGRGATQKILEKVFV
jgi:3-deoxy-D-manno-octulosonic-acid transferase